jgi:hypothetical protein
MKRLISYGLLLCLTAALVWGYSGKVLLPKPPLRPLGDGYSIALQALGVETNNYYCIGAKISHEWCPWTYAGEWVFSFDKNTVEHKTVYVAMRAWDTNANPRTSPPWPLTEVRYTCDIPSLTNGMK